MVQITDGHKFSEYQASEKLKCRLFVYSYMCAAEAGPAELSQDTSCSSQTELNLYKHRLQTEAKLSCSDTEILPVMEL